MNGSKTAEGLIPEGLVVSNLHGEVGGVFTISGVVERSEIKVGRLVVSSSGTIRNGAIEADETVIKGHASHVLFRVGRLNISETAILSDCVIEISNATGISMHEGAQFTGEIKFTTQRQNSILFLQPETVLEQSSADILIDGMVHTDIETDIPLGD